MSDDQLDGEFSRVEGEDGVGPDGREQRPSPHDEVEVAEADSSSDDFDEEAVLEDIMGIVEDDPPSADADLATAIAQRDEYLEALQRVKAEFDNFRKRTERERREVVARAAENLVFKLLPVLDACEAALLQGATDVEPIAKVLAETLDKEGLEPVGEKGEAFDPQVHEAVMQEPAENEEDAQTIAEVLRTGYRWKGVVIRTAMVKVWG